MIVNADNQISCNIEFLLGHSKDQVVERVPTDPADSGQGGRAGSVGVRVYFAFGNDRIGVVCSAILNTSTWVVIVVARCRTTHTRTVFLVIKGRYLHVANRKRFDHFSAGIDRKSNRNAPGLCSVMVKCERMRVSNFDIAYKQGSFLDG